MWSRESGSELFVAHWCVHLGVWCLCATRGPAALDGVTGWRAGPLLHCPMAARLTHYEVLELPSDATEAEIRRAYKRLAVRWHPVRDHGRQCVV